MENDNVSMCITGKNGAVMMGWPFSRIPAIGETVQTPFHPDSPLTVTAIVNTILVKGGYDPENDDREIGDDEIETYTEIYCTKQAD